MQRIRDQAEEDVNLANRIILWVLRAFRPMKLTELQQALAVAPGESELDESAIIDEDLLLSVCAGLVIVERESNNVCLVHYSAKQYFDWNQPGDISGADLYMAKTCLTYLLFDDFAKGFDGSEEQLVEEANAFPLIPYAAAYWGYHFQKAQDNEVRFLATNLLQHRTKLASAYRYMSAWGSKGWVRVFNGLHIAALFGSAQLAQMVLRARDMDINLQNDVGQTPLSVACKNGALTLVETLLAVKDVDVNAGRDTLTGTALHSAAAFGHPKLVRTLLDRGADIHALTSRLHTPLHTAAEAGHVRIIELFLHAGSDVQAKTDTGTTALYRSIRSRNLDALLTLLRHDQDVNVATWDSWTPLHEAVECNQVAMAQELLRVGADTGIRNADGHTAVDMAEFLGRKSIVEVLGRAQGDWWHKRRVEVVVSSVDCDERMDVEF